VVKNYTASGNYYWVLANVTPDYDSKNKLEGFSVRRPPGRRAVETVIPIYARMCQLESTLNKASAPDASMEWLLAELDKQGHSYESFVLSLLDPHLSTGRSA
jgi:aerotaxis receptor